MIDRIARHYAGRWRQGYVRGKLRSDPAYAAAFELLRDSPLPVLDLGCGIGLLEFYLRERGFTSPLFGVDFDAKKIAEAQRIAAACYAGVNFAVGDFTRVAEALTLPAGNVVLFDLLHYLPADAQRTLLDRVRTCVAPGGRCLIRATPRDSSLRFRITQLEELFIHGSRWMKSGAVAYMTVEEVIAPFRASNFACAVRPLWGRTPFNSHLFIFRRPE